MSGFDLRQAQGVWQRKPSVRILAHLPAVQDSFSAAAGTSAAQSGNNAPALPRLGGAELIYAAPNYSLGAGAFSPGGGAAGSAVVPRSSDGAAQSPAQSLVPLTVPTSLQPIGADGFTCFTGLLPLGAAV